VKLLVLRGYVVRIPEVWPIEWNEDLSLSLVRRLLAGDANCVTGRADRGVHEADSVINFGSSDAFEAAAIEVAGESAYRLCGVVATEVTAPLGLGLTE
jgi:hypothetical protein